MMKLTHLLFYGLMLLVALVSAPWILFLCIKIATTTYRVEWVGADGTVWWRPMEKSLGDGRNLISISFSDYWTKNQASYELRVGCIINGPALADSLKVCLESRNGGNREEMLSFRPISCREDKILYSAVLPESFSPHNEDDRLNVYLYFRDNNDSLCIEFKAKRMCHYFNIFTDIT